VVNYPEAASKKLSEPVFVMIGVILAMAMYLIRKHKPFVYGMSEVTIGIAAVFLATRSPISADVLTKLLGILGGVYIMIRGFDNASKQVPPKFVPYWKVLLGDPSGTGLP
jgi:hypothetical protein